MKVLLIGDSGDEVLTGHARFLLEQGWTVHLADLSECAIPHDFDSRVRLHSVVRARDDIEIDARPAWAMPKSPHELERRVRVALARASYGAVHEARRRRGMEIDVSGVAMLPLPWLDQDGNPGEVARVYGIQPQVDTPWLGGLIERLQPHVINSVGFVWGGLLVQLLDSWLGMELPPWMLTLSDFDEVMITGDPALAAAFGAAITQVAGVLVEREEELAFARSAGFSEDMVAVAPVRGGWDVSELKPLRHPGHISQRRAIAVSGVRGIGGRPFVALRGIELAADALRDYEIVIFAPGDGVEIAARLLAVRTGLRIVIEPSTSENAFLHALGRSRCTVALNAGQRIDRETQLAILMGSFPIVADSCREAGWLRGFLTGLLVDAEHPRAVAAAIRLAVSDDELVDSAASANQTIMERRLSRDIAGRPILELYRQLANRPPRD